MGEEDRGGGYLRGREGGEVGSEGGGSPEGWEVCG